MEAYRKGLFPWFSDGDPVLWWSPDPRMVLHTEDIHISKSLNKQLRQIARQQQNQDFQVVVTINQAFEAVIEGCAIRGGGGARHNGSDTWITADMQHAYRQWHVHGGVHSVETWIDGELAGGLYGVGLGRMFFGESMFTRVPNASKIALVHLVRFLRQQGVVMIDCQMQTDHLASLGARLMDRHTFVEHVKQAVADDPINWQASWLSVSGTRHPGWPAGMAEPAARFGYDYLP
jgi:leucyl/phenylalanyl-tRNA--protein transferase